jgi:hypothetical protein
VYENDEPNDVDALVYVEDLSQNGTYWKGCFIGKGSGGFLLSDGDVLRLSRQTYLVFQSVPQPKPNPPGEVFDYVQEVEMDVSRSPSGLSTLTVADVP